MSSPSQTSSPSSNLKSMLDAALAEYRKKTGDDLLAHWLATELQTCDSVDAVLDILRDQAKSFERFGDQRLMKWVDPMVHVLHTFSDTLGDGLSLAFPPAKVIFTGIGVLLAAAKGARASHGAIIDLFERVESFFKRLEVYTQISLTTAMAEVLVKIVIELLSILSVATKEVRRPLAKLFARKLLGRTDIEDALKRLDSLIQEEVQMAIAQNLKITTEVKDGADKTGMVVQKVLNDLEEVKDNVEEVKWAQIEQDIRKWFSPPDPYTNYNVACEAQYKGTTAWLFQDKIFKRWVSVGSLLWIHGKPGSGKSILCSAIIKHVMSLRDAGLASLAFFYFDFRDKEKKQDVRNFVTSLLTQLSADSSPCCKIISDIYSTHGKGTQQPSNGALTNCLRKMFLAISQQPIYIIVDALDECPNFSGIPTPREALLNLLEDLVLLRPPNLHICVTSRLEVDIKNVLEPLASAVSLHDQIGQKRDISNYVSNFVSSDRMMRRWRSGEKELVVEVLSKRADGMFRWVFCQLEVLRHCLPASIRQTLEQLPESLDETYVRVLSQIPQANQAHAHRMLQCLVVAVRPLRVEELAELLAFEFDAAQGGIPKYRADWQLDDQTQAVLSTCSSLVTIVSYWNRQIVQFSHFSVKEFLTSDRLTSSLGDFSLYQILPGSAHTILARACLGSLLHLDGHSILARDGLTSLPHSDGHSTRRPDSHTPLPRRPTPPSRPRRLRSRPPSPPPLPLSDGHSILWPDSPTSLPYLDDDTYEESVEGYHLARYAARYWFEHARFEDVASRVKDGMETLFDSDKPHFAAWIGIYDMDTPMAYERGYSHRKISPNRNPLYYSVLCGFYNLVKHLAIKHPQHVNAICGRYRFPLLAALNRDHVEVAELLLRHGANIGVREITGKTILLMVLAWSRDNLVNMVKFLLKYGADVNAQDDSLRSPLHLTVCNRLEIEVTQILLKHKADANCQDNNGKTPLHILSEPWIYNREIACNHARLLLEHGAEANRRDKDNRTPLLLAIAGRRYMLARILLEHGADANVESKDGETPLHLLVKDHAVDENDVLGLVPLLLERGEVNRRDKDNQTPLLLAITGRRYKLARILLEHGADANVESKDGKTPLYLLVEDHTHDESDVLGLVPLLLEHGVGLDRRDKDNQTPVLLAMERGWFKLARILLEHGADVNGKSNNGKTLMHLVAEAGYVSERDRIYDAQLLLGRGVDVNARDEGNRTPLHLASYYGRIGMVLVLLNAGANPSAKDAQGQTPLHLVSQCPHYLQGDGVGVAKLLLERGADVNAQNKNHPTALDMASYHGRTEIASLLLQYDDNANTKMVRRPALRPKDFTISIVAPSTDSLSVVL